MVSSLIILIFWGERNEWVGKIAKRGLQIPRYIIARG